MSEIPYVNQLGDALDDAIARRARAPRLRRLGHRRYLAVALVALMVAGGGAAVAGLFSDPVETGFGSVGCFDDQDLGGGASVISDPTRAPLEICAEVLASEGLTASDLIACTRDGSGVVVMPRGRSRSCAALDLAPLPASYTRARVRAVRLQAVAVEFERNAGCLAPSEFARDLTTELRRRGWRDWRALAAGGDGPCGRVSVRNGSSIVGSIGPAVDALQRTIAVKGEPPLDLELMVNQPGSPGVRLFDETGERCFTVTALEQRVREALGPAKVPISFETRSLPPYVGVMPPRGLRYDEGCAIYDGAHFVYPDGRIAIVAELSQRDAPER